MIKLIVFLSFSILSTLLTADDNKTYQFLSGEFTPYTGANLKNGGLATEIVSTTITAMGAQVDFTYLPWRRGHILAKQGDYFAIFPYSHSDERKKHWFYSDPLYTLEERIYVKNGKPFTFNNNQDLHTKNICRPKGYNLFGLDKLRDQGLLSIEQPSDLRACFLMLDIGRVDAVITNPRTAWDLITGLGFPKYHFKEMSKPFLLNTHYLIVSKVIDEGPKFLEAFNKQLQALKKAGHIDKIMTHQP